MVSRILTALLTASLFLCLASNPSLAGPAPKTIGFTGLLTAVTGTPISGDQTVHLALYDSDTGGTALWSEDKTVHATRGLFSTALGSQTAFPTTLDFSQALFVGVTAGTDPEMSPRIALQGVPYALFAQTVADGSVSSAKLASDAASLANVSAGALTSDGTNVGVGSTDLTDKLDVGGNIRLTGAAAGTIGFPLVNGGGKGLTIEAGGNAGSSGAAVPGGDLVLRAGSANVSGASTPPVNSPFNNSVKIYAGDNVFGGAYGNARNGNVEFYAGDGLPQRMILVGDNGNVGIGNANPGQKLSVAGVVESTSGGIKFPDGTMQTTAATGAIADNSVTSAKLASDAASLTKVSGGAMASSSGNIGIGTASPTGALDVRGNVKLGDGSLFASGGPENLRIVRGTITGANGSITAGSGFTVSRQFAGYYRVTFSPAFSGVPSVTVSPDDGSIATAQVNGTFTSEVDILTRLQGTLTDLRSVHFIAVGPR